MKIEDRTNYYLHGERLLVVHLLSDGQKHDWLFRNKTVQ